MNLPLIIHNSDNITLTGINDEVVISLTEKPEAVIIIPSSLNISLNSLQIHYYNVSALSILGSHSVAITNVNFTSVPGGTESLAINSRDSTVSLRNCYFNGGYNKLSVLSNDTEEVVIKHEEYSQAIYSLNSIIGITNCSLLDSYGTVIELRGSHVNFSGHNLFSANTMDALISIYDGYIVFNGVNTFCQNNGLGYTGVVVDVYSSYVDFYGLTVFNDNNNLTAIRVSYDGVIRIYDRAIFDRNSAAIHAVRARFELNDQVTFCNHDKGVINLSMGSMNGSGEIEFISNNISDSGASVYSVMANIYLQGNVKFVENLAKTGNGGAIHAVNSMVYLEGNISFINNSAEGGQDGGLGGAILFLDSSKLESIGNVSFISNEARSRGGAVYALGSSISQTSRYHRYERNRAQSGGAIVFDGDSSLFAPIVAEFTGNKAKLDGGALFFLDSNPSTQRFEYIKYLLLQLEWNPGVNFFEE